MHIFRWDVDKTYLETNFSSFRGLLRTAVESADQKKNVPGSAALLRSLIAANPDCRVTVISGSPTQLRSVLEEKFTIDGVDIDDLVLKDNLRNLRKGRFKAITNQIGYKLPALFQQRRGLGPTVTETLFGDDTEADALIYALYAHALAGRVEDSHVARVMAAMDTPAETIDGTLSALRATNNGDVVEHVFIRIHRGLPINCYSKLGRNVIPVFSWFQAALVLFTAERLNAEGLQKTMEACFSSSTIVDDQIVWLLQDVVRRRVLNAQHLDEVLTLSPNLLALKEALKQVRSDLGVLSSKESNTPLDFLGFVRDIQRRK